MTKTGKICVCLGTALILAALSLFWHNQKEAAWAGAQASAVVSVIESQLSELKNQAIIPEPTEETEPIEVYPWQETQPTEPPSTEMTAVEISGNWYIGYLSIPDLELNLPVMADWNYDKLKLSPCRYFGSSKSDDLVLMAHNYVEHFGYLGSLRVGNRLTFTDMDGVTTHYEVVAVEILDASAIEDMTAGVYDLTLFTCTYGGQSRVTVRCDRLELPALPN